MAPRERILITGQVPLGKGGIIASPFQFYTSGEDMLRVRLWAAGIRGLVNTQVFRVSLRLISALDGTTAVTSDTMTPVTDTVVQTLLIPLTAGFIQTCSVSWASTVVTTTPGLCYCVVDLIRGTSSGAQLNVGQLLGGYVAPGQALSWPGTPISGPLDGPGYQGTFTLAGVVGAEVTIAAQQFLVWKVRAVELVFAASAAAGARRPHLTCLGNSINFYSLIPYPADVIATATVNCGFAPGFSYFTGTANFTATAPLPPDIVMRFGDSLKSLTVGLQAGDQYTRATLLFDEYMEPLP